MVIGKECSPGRGPHFARCHTDESPGHLLSSQTSQSRQLAALSEWTARKHLTRSARRADRRCPQPFVDGSSLPPAGQDDPGPGVRRPNPGSGCRAGTARATPRAVSRPTRRRPKRPNQALRDVRPFSAARKSRNSPRHRPTGKSPSLSPGIGLPVPEHKAPSALDARQAHRGGRRRSGTTPARTGPPRHHHFPHGRRNTMRQRHFRREYGTHRAPPRVTHLREPGDRGAINPAHCDTTGFRPHNSGQAVTGNMGGLSIR